VNSRIPEEEEEELGCTVWRGILVPKHSGSDEL